MEDQDLHVCEVHSLVTDNLEMHRLIIEAIATENLNDFNQCCSGWLVLMEKVAPKKYKIHLSYLSPHKTTVNSGICLYPYTWLVQT